MNEKIESDCPHEQPQRPLLVIAGPTAVGKSEAAVEVARRIGGEIVSADSMQVYRHMDIGSAKITKEEMMGVPHHMIDVVDPDEEMDVARYASMASEAIRSIYARGHMPILCGGTGFYIQAVTRKIDFEETDADPAYRKELSSIFDEKGADYLHAKLKEIDPKAAEEIHPNNKKRVIRALEYYKETGRCISDHNEEEKKRSSPYDLAFFVINMDRDLLYERINDRVDFMMQEGLVDEVLYLRAMGLSRDNVSMQGLGYKEMLDYFDGRTTLDEAVEIIKRDSRHFAKRQITWFKREEDAIWLDRLSFGDARSVADYIVSILKDRSFGK